MDPIAAALDEAARTGLMPPGASILLAVSGGADSMALLHAASEHGSGAGWRLAVGHVHHGWRGRQADRDLIFVRDQSQRLDLPFFSRRVDARGEARAMKLSPEAGARQVRYTALAGIAREAGAEIIATAHQRDDRVESLLLFRERKAGLAGLAGPHRRREDGIVRPMLEVSRGEIREFLRSRGLTYRRDASNGDLRLARNRVRRELARLCVEQGESVRLALLEEAGALAAEREAVARALADNADWRLSFGPGLVVADAPVLQRFPPEVQRHALAQAAAPFAAAGRPPVTGREREELLRRLAAGSDFRFEAGRRIRFEREGRLLRIFRRPETHTETVYHSPETLAGLGGGQGLPKGRTQSRETARSPAK